LQRSEIFRRIRTISNFPTWNCTNTGPPDTIWDGGKFNLTLRFTRDYPIDPPTARFQSPMFHPNVFPGGRVCIDTLQQNSRPANTVMSVLISIQLLLNDPNPRSPANTLAAACFRNNKQEYIRRVAEIVQRSKSPDETASSPPILAPIGLV
jgi:ubiquitin-conjugating enzyme E2 A